ncbi:MAG: hypothetical protein JO304_06585, partial [Solirubrobacterales bacterium]|nr:hypothetical protein [Solirubrobacterales bacterium]
MPLALQSIEGVTGRRAMAPRWRLSTLAGAFALAAMLAVAIPAAASAALVGSENGVTLAAGWNAATQSHQFWWPPGTLTSVPQVTYSINGFGHLTTIYGQDELTCKNNSANTVSKLSKAYSRRCYQAVTLTWLPPLACPAG